MSLSHSQRAKDKVEDLQACREAHTLLEQAKELIEKAKRKLKYNKEVNIDHDLNVLMYNLNDCIENLNDASMR